MAQKKTLGILPAFRTFQQIFLMSWALMIITMTKEGWQLILYTCLISVFWVCTHVHLVYVCTCVWRSKVDIKYPSLLLFTLVFYQGTESLPFYLIRLASESQESVHLCTPNNWCCRYTPPPWAFTWELGIWTRLLTLAQQAISSEPWW